MNENVHWHRHCQTTVFLPHPQLILNVGDLFTHPPMKMLIAATRVCECKRNQTPLTSTREINRFCFLFQFQQIKIVDRLFGCASELMCIIQRRKALESAVVIKLLKAIFPLNGMFMFCLLLLFSSRISPETPSIFTERDALFQCPLFQKVSIKCHLLS